MVQIESCETFQYQENHEEADGEFVSFSLTV